MYHLYQTPAFVLSAQNISEGSRLLCLFTRELGLVRVHARSIREERSKLRGFLQPLSYAEVALVRGKDLWRLTTAGAAASNLVVQSWPKERSLARIALVLERLLSGEERDVLLYDELTMAISFLPGLPEHDIVSWEVLVMARLLSQLGYCDLSPFASLQSESWGAPLLVRAREERRKLVPLVNQAMTASQL